MCEIFFLYAREDSVSDHSLRELLSTAVDANQTNCDGFGVFNEKKRVYKTDEQYSKEDLDTVFKRFRGSKFVVLHLRQATQGSISYENTHPFSFGDNLLCHNGMITANFNEYTEKPDETDSYQLLKAIEHQGGDSTPEQLKAVLGDVSGSLSVFYYGDALYYFRDGAAFTFAYNFDTHEVLGATRKRRLTGMYQDRAFEFFPTTRHDLVYREPDAETVYTISDEGITAVGTFHSAMEYDREREWLYPTDKHAYHPFEPQG